MTNTPSFPCRESTPPPPPAPSEAEIRAELIALGFDVAPYRGSDRAVFVGPDAYVVSNGALSVPRLNPAAL